MSYVTTANMELEEKILRDHDDLSDFAAQGDKEILDLAERLGVDEDDFTDPLHQKILDYGLSYAVWKALRSYAGINNNDLRVDVDRYWVKSREEWYGYYRDLGTQITYQMFTGEVESPAGRARTALGLRG